MKRLFVAISLPEEVSAILVGWRKRHQGQLPAARWTDADNLHLTVKFLGDVEDDRLEALKSALEDALTGVSPFELELEKVSLAPPGRRPTMIWADFVAESGYAVLAAAVAGAAAPFAADMDDKPPLAHVTLARFRRTLSPSGARLSQPAATDMTLRVVSADLMESRLTPNGPVYTRLSTFPLAG